MFDELNKQQKAAVWMAIDSYLNAHGYKKKGDHVDHVKQLILIEKKLREDIV